MDNELNLKVTDERVKGLPLDVFYFLQEGEPKTILDYIAHFVTGPNGEYLPREEAVKKVISGRTVGDLEDIAAQLMEAIEIGIVPNG